MINYKAKINNEILNRISIIEEFRGEWKAIKQMSPEILNYLKKVATIESVGASNRIEGNKLSDKEVEKILSNVKMTSFKSRDEEEVAGYAEVSNLIFNDYEIVPFTENYIKQLHSILLKYSSKDERHRGEYKTLSNSVSAFRHPRTRMRGRRRRQREDERILCGDGNLQSAAYRQCP